MYRILIVEDDEKIASVIQRNLEKYHFEALCASHFRDLMSELTAFNPHLVLLDINLPYFDGYYWCRQIRARSNLPIMFISAREGEMDQVMAIENGGDDYITKPIMLDLLVAKVRSVLRRVYGDYAAVSELPPPPEPDIVAEGLTLSLSRNELIWQQRKIELTKNEQLLAECLLVHCGTAVTRDQLLETLWDDTQFVDDNTLTVNVKRLRNKLGELGLPDAIRTVRGIGYKLVLGEESESQKGDHVYE